MSMPHLPGANTDCRRIFNVLSLMGDKWTALIVIVLSEQPRRFNDIKRTVGEISQQMLARALKALERDGMLTRTVHPTVPPQVEYSLTELGHSLSEPVIQMGVWAGTHMEEIEINRALYDAAAEDKVSTAKGALPVDK